MKKVLALLLALVLVLSLAACGGGSGSNGESSSIESQEETKKEITTDSIVGSWVAKTDDYPTAMDLYKGGVGKLYEDKSYAGHPEKGLEATWVLNDDSIVVHYNFADRNYPFEIIDENTIKRLDSGTIYEKK